MKILVVGGTNVDIYGRVSEKLIMEDSNNGVIDVLYGGVGKNIAYNLAKLNLDVTFVSVLGNDFKEEIKTYFNNNNIKAIINEVNVSTPKYLAIFNEENDFSVGVNDMEALSFLNKEFLKKVNINSYDLLVVDANLSNEAIEYLTSVSKIPIYAESISIKKVLKFKPFLNRLEAIKCNIFEAKSLANLNTNNIEELAKRIYSFGVKEVYITDGGNGSYLYKESVLTYQPSFKEKIVNTSGAGDAFFSGVIYAKVNNKDELLYGSGLASIILNSKYSNNENLTNKLLESVVNKYESSN